MRIAAFRGLPPDPPLREVRLDVAPVDTHNLEWKGPAGRGTGFQPYLTLDLKAPTYVSGAADQVVRQEYRGDECVVPGALAQQSKG